MIIMSFGAEFSTCAITESTTVFAFGLDGVMGCQVLHVKP